MPPLKENRLRLAIRNTDMKSGTAKDAPTWTNLLGLADVGESYRLHYLNSLNRIQTTGS